MADRDRADLRATVAIFAVGGQTRAPLYFAIRARGAAVGAAIRRPAAGRAWQYGRWARICVEGPFWAAPYFREANIFRVDGTPVDREDLPLAAEHAAARRQP